MAIPRERRTKAGAPPRELGLTAIGSSGPWEIAVDESTSGPNRWFAQIEGPSIYLRFEIASLEIVEEILEFLARSAGENGGHGHESPSDSLAISGGKSEVLLLRDDEFSDRFFLVIQPSKGPLTRLTIAGDDLTHVLAALRQVAEDLR
ncbi:MAG TPA: hypothetical protein VNH11_21670 [Pirellulales bacterium]|nr:hypothetical protein [Pirellulales bacterium]